MFMNLTDLYFCGALGSVWNVENAHVTLVLLCVCVCVCVCHVVLRVWMGRYW